jgi:hypothetical protein
MRRRRSVVWLARGLAVLLVSLVTLLAAVAVALQTSWAREQIRVQVNAALEPLFQGRIQIDRIGQVGLSGVSGVDARIFDPAGEQVIRVQGLRAVAWLPWLGCRVWAGSWLPTPTLPSSRSCWHRSITRTLRCARTQSSA